MGRSPSNPFWSSRYLRGRRWACSCYSISIIINGNIGKSRCFSRRYQNRVSSLLPCTFLAHSTLSTFICLCFKSKISISVLYKTKAFLGAFSKFKLSTWVVNSFWILSFFKLLKNYSSKLTFNVFGENAQEVVSFLNLAEKSWKHSLSNSKYLRNLIISQNLFMGCLST